ncbi:MAG: TonB family protein, partial [Acidimicrobiales bacterium]|nr:TonB family protein [Acidimicrobiales bacterium]
AHLLLALLVARVSAAGFGPAPPPPVELEIVEQPPPLPEPPAALPEPPPPPEPRARDKPRALPPPNREVKPPREPPREMPRPVFGVTEETVVEGESDVAVPVGNTLMTKDRTPGPPTPLPGPYGEGEFAPEPGDRVASRPEFELERNYPAEAEREGIKARVVLEVAVDRKGKVRAVKVLRRAGYGMDEAAVQSMWKARVKPARTRDGRAVDWVGPHNVDFTPAELPE